VTPSSRSARIDRYARRTVIGALLLGVLATVAPTVPRWRESFDSTPLTSRTVTETVTHLDAHGRMVSQIRTRKPADADIVVQLLDAGGVVVARLVLVLLTAFLAGGLVQRVLLARYGFKLGPLDLPDLEQTIITSETLATELVALQTDAASQRRAVASVITRSARSADVVARLSRSVATLQREVARLESKR
jgi:hypothetical protein